MSPDFAPVISPVLSEQVVPAGPLAADFTVNPASPVVNQATAFSASITGGTPPYVAAWDFGDGATGTGLLVTHTYAALGTYVVTLFVADVAGTARTVTKSVTVIPLPALQVATNVTFRATSPDPSTAGQTITLGAILERLAPIRSRMAGELLIMELSQDVGVTWSEVARDVTGLSGDLFVPFTFTLPGSYLLRARYEGRIDAATNTQFLPDESNIESHTVIPAGPGPLTADFGFSPTSPLVGQSVLFTAAVSGGTTPYSAAWNFGDGATGIGASVSHTYTAPGTYNVVLTVTDGVGSAVTVMKVVTVAVTTTDVASTLSLTTSPNPSQVNQAVTASGRLTRTLTGVGVSGQSVVLEQSPDGVASWAPVPGVPASVTDGNGNYTFSLVFSAQGSLFLRTRFDGATV